MKRVFGLLGLMVLLAGCSSQNRELNDVMRFREKLLSAGSCSFRAEITADYGEELSVFTADCQADSDGRLHFEILEPKTVAGICGTISDSGGALTFEDTALYFDLLADDQLTPVSAPWIMLKSLRSGYISSVCEDGEYLRVTVDDSYEEDAMTLDIRMKDAVTPVTGDIFWDGRKILSLKVEEFRIS